LKIDTALLARELRRLSFKAGTGGGEGSEAPTANVTPQNLEPSHAVKIVRLLRTLCQRWEQHGSLDLRKAKLWRRLIDDYQALPVKASDIGQALTREQLRHLAEVASNRKDWEAAFYGSVLAANTGLRGGEIKKLRLGCMDLGSGRAFRTALSRSPSHVHHNDGGTGCAPGSYSINGGPH
jgi:integrase